MLAAILLFVMTVVSTAGGGITNAPGLADPQLPAKATAELQSRAVEALLNANRPATIPANDATIGDEDATVDTLATDGDDVDVSGKPEGSPVHPVDTTNAPANVDLTDVPANESSNVPDAVGANEHAELPARAGGTSASSCASTVDGRGAPECGNS